MGHADWQKGSYKDLEPYYRSFDSLMPELPEDDTKFNYTGVGGGMWDLRSTQQFPSNRNRTYTTGLTGALDTTFQEQPINFGFNQRTVNISRYANRSARVVFQFILIDQFVFTDSYLDSISVSGTTYTFDSTTESWQTTTTNVQGTAYESLAWTTMASTATRNRVYRANTDLLFGGSYPAPSGFFSVGSAYDTIYGEPQNHTMWIRSPVVSLGANPTLSYYYFHSSDNLRVVFYTYLDLQ